VKDPLTTKPATLFEFRTIDDLSMWKTFADSVFGGKSSAILEHSGPLQVGCVLAVWLSYMLGSFYKKRRTQLCRRILPLFVVFIAEK